MMNENEAKELNELENLLQKVDGNESNKNKNMPHSIRAKQELK